MLNKFSNNIILWLSLDNGHDFFLVLGFHIYFYINNLQIFIDLKMESSIMESKTFKFLM